jgi:hypothetical protein
LYVTLSRSNAKKILWPDLLRLNDEYAMGGKPDNTELSLKMPNGSVIYLSGAKDKTEIEKFRGLPLKLVYIDECQSFKSYIEELVNEVLSKALFDYNGTICLIGTPGAVPVGFFWECSNGKASSGWSNHHWTMFENPHLEKKSGKTVQALVEEDLIRMGVTIEDPRIQRECFGRWVIDYNSLVFRYDSKINDFINQPKVNDWEYIIGVDIGHDDADAIAVIGWSKHLKESYLVHEDIAKKQGITELALKLDDLIKKYNPLKVVMDTGGLGKKIAEEIRRRFTIPIVAAEKSRKFEFIELLNDALRTKKFFAKKESVFAEECMLLEWDLDITDPNKLKISERFHSDITDAVLYGFRESLHWLFEEPKKVAPIHSAQWFREQEDLHIEEALKRSEEHKNNDFEEGMVWNESNDY